MMQFLRNFLCLSFVGIVVGLLWFTAAQADNSTPSIPPLQQRHFLHDSAQVDASPDAIPQPDYHAV